MKSIKKQIESYRDAQRTQKGLYQSYMKKELTQRITEKIQSYTEN